MGYSQLLRTQQAAGTAFSNYTTAKSVINAQALLKIPAGTLAVGDKIRIFATGGLSNIVTTPGLMNFQVKLGPTANIVAADTGNVQLNATAHVLLPFTLEWWLRVNSIGPGATAAQFMHIARVHGVHFTRTAGQVDAVNTGDSMLLPAIAPALGTAFDSTVDNILDFWAGFTIANAGNAIQIQQYDVELLSERN